MKKIYILLATSFALLILSSHFSVKSSALMVQIEKNYAASRGVERLSESFSDEYRVLVSQYTLKDRLSVPLVCNSDFFSYDEVNIESSIKDNINSTIAQKVKEYEEQKAREEAERAKREASQKSNNGTNNGTNKGNQQSNDKLGTAGRLYIPDVGVSVALYYGSSQSIVDAKDSAAYFSFGSEDVIADHNNQGFNAIKSAHSGTKAYIKTNSGTETWVCIEKVKGNNTGRDIVTSDGRSAWDCNPGGLCMYTCNENWQNITITFWKRQ